MSYTPKYLGHVNIFVRRYESGRRGDRHAPGKLTRLEKMRCCGDGADPQERHGVVLPLTPAGAQQLQ